MSRDRRVSAGMSLSRSATTQVPHVGQEELVRVFHFGKPWILQFCSFHAPSLPEVLFSIFVSQVIISEFTQATLALHKLQVLGSSASLHHRLDLDLIIFPPIARSLMPSGKDFQV